MSACRWNEKHTIEKTWTQFKSHFAAAHRQHKQIQEESAATDSLHFANTAVTYNEDNMAEATIGELANLATATTADPGCGGSSHSGEFSSSKTAEGQLHRVEGTKGFAQEGTK
jgi:hypothetical protein